LIVILTGLQCLTPRATFAYAGRLGGGAGSGYPPALELSLADLLHAGPLLDDDSLLRRRAFDRYHVARSKGDNAMRHIRNKTTRVVWSEH